METRIPTPTEFRRQLQHFPAARKAFDTLITEGSNAVNILLWLHIYCSGEMVNLVREKRTHSAAAEKLAKQLLEDADKLQLLERSGLFSMGDISHPQLLPFSQQLQSHAKLLSAEAKKEGKRYKRKAPRLALAWLASQVEGSTGKTHYGEIAHLVEAYKWILGVHEDVSAAAIGKKVKRFRDDHELAYRHMTDIGAGRWGELGTRPLLPTQESGKTKKGSGRTAHKARRGFGTKEKVLKRPA